MTKTNVFFFPFAGSSKYAYTPFVSMAPKNVAIIPLEMPGRGARFSETLLYTLTEMAEDALNQIKNKIQQPFLFFGHSMGALIGYLLIQKLRDNDLPLPLHFFASGCAGPSILPPYYEIGELSRDSFIQELKEFGGCPQEILENEAIMELFEPILRADFKAAQSFRKTNTNPFPIPITVLIGENDLVNPDQAQAWEKETTQKLYYYSLPGSHFFIFEHVPFIVEQIAKTVKTFT